MKLPDWAKEICVQKCSTMDELHIAADFAEKVLSNQWRKLPDVPKQLVDVLVYYGDSYGVELKIAEYKDGIFVDEYETVLAENLIMRWMEIPEVIR